MNIRRHSLIFVLGTLGSVVCAQDLGDKYRHLLNSAEQGWPQAPLSAPDKDFGPETKDSPVEHSVGLKLRWRLYERLAHLRARVAGLKTATCDDVQTRAIDDIRERYAVYLSSFEKSCLLRDQLNDVCSGIPQRLGDFERAVRGLELGVEKRCPSLVIAGPFQVPDTRGNFSMFGTFQSDPRFGPVGQLDQRPGATAHISHVSELVNGRRQYDISGNLSFEPTSSANGAVADDSIAAGVVQKIGDHSSLGARGDLVANTDFFAVAPANPKVLQTYRRYGGEAFGLVGETKLWARYEIRRTNPSLYSGSLMHAALDWKDFELRASKYRPTTAAVMPSWQSVLLTYQRTWDSQLSTVVGLQDRRDASGFKGLYPHLELTMEFPSYQGFAWGLETFEGLSGPRFSSSIKAFAKAEESWWSATSFDVGINPAITWGWNRWTWTWDSQVSMINPQTAPGGRRKDWLVRNALLPSYRVNSKLHAFAEAVHEKYIGQPFTTTATSNPVGLWAPTESAQRWSFKLGARYEF